MKTNRSFVSYAGNNHAEVLAAIQRKFPTAILNGPEYNGRQLITVVGVEPSVKNADVRKAIPRSVEGHMFPAR